MNPLGQHVVDEGDLGAGDRSHLGISEGGAVGCAEYEARMRVIGSEEFVLPTGVVVQSETKFGWEAKTSSFSFGDRRRLSRFRVGPVRTCLAGRSRS